MHGAGNGTGMGVQRRRPRRDEVRPVTIRQVAAAAGVAPMTVSRTLRQPDLVAEATRTRVLEVIRSTGFIRNAAAGSLGAGRSPIVTAIVGTIANSIIAETIQGLSDGLAGSGYQLLLGDCGFSPKQEEVLVRVTMGWRPAGLVLVRMTHSRATRALLKRSRTPTVEINEIDGRQIGMTVGLSNATGGRGCASLLLPRGCRRIGLVLGDPTDNERLSHRRDGFLSVLREAGIEASASVVVEAPMTVDGGGTALLRLLERMPDLDGCLFASEHQAIGALHICHRRGIRVPEQIAVVGWGDSGLASTTVPPLTTLRTPRYEIGRTTAKCLLERFAGTIPAHRRFDLGFEIIRRQSA